MRILVIAALLLGGDRIFAQTADSTIVPFAGATSLAIDPMGNRYYLDGEKDQLVKLSVTGRPERRTGGYGWSDVSFDGARDIAVPNALDVYVADYGNHRIVRYDQNLNFVSTTPPQSAPDGSDRPFAYPKSLCVSRRGELFVLDGDNARIVKYSDENTLEKAFGNTGIGEARLRKPARVRVTADDLVYVQDGAQLKVYDIFGRYVRTVGAGIFNEPIAMTVGGPDILVVDSSRVYRVAEGGRIDLIDPVDTSLLAPRHEKIIDIAVYQDTLFGVISGRLLPLAVLAKQESR